MSRVIRSSGRMPFLDVAAEADRADDPAPRPVGRPLPTRAIRSDQWLPAHLVLMATSAAEDSVPYVADPDPAWSTLREHRGAVHATPQEHLEDVAWCSHCATVTRDPAHPCTWHAPYIAPRIVGAELPAALDGPLATGRTVTTSYDGRLRGPAVDGTGHAVRPDVTPQLWPRTAVDLTGGNARLVWSPRTTAARADGGAVTIYALTARGRWTAARMAYWDACHTHVRTGYVRTGRTVTRRGRTVPAVARRIAYVTAVPRTGVEPYAQGGARRPTFTAADLRPVTVLTRAGRPDGRKTADAAVRAKRASAAGRAKRAKASAARVAAARARLTTTL